MSKTTPDTPDKASGPLPLPAPAGSSARVIALRTKLHGHTTSLDWLPSGEWPELDELRAEQQRLRAQVEAELHALDQLTKSYREQDLAYEEALRQGHRDGRPEAVTDNRTSLSDRTAAQASIEERLWAGIDVWAEHADRVIATIRRNEDAWLADLRVRLRPAQEKQREAARLLAEAQREEFRVHRLGQWLMTTADDEAFGRQPAPMLADVPANVPAQAHRHSLERPWHKAKPWNRDS